MKEKLKIEEIPISQLKISEYNVRSDPGDVTELANSIEQDGLVQPLLVRPESNGKIEYGIVIGSRRFTAARDANLKQVPAIIHNLDPDDALRFSLIENLQRNDLEPKDAAEGIAELLKRNKVAKIAKELGYTDQWVMNYANLSNLVGKIDDFIKVEKLPDEEKRLKGQAIPLNHAIHLGNAICAPKVKKYYEAIGEKEADRKTVEVAKTISPYKQKNAQKILETFKKEPEEDIETIISDAHLESDKGGLGGWNNDNGPKERTELTKMGDIRDGCRQLCKALTDRETMPTQNEDLIVDYIKPTRAFRQGIIAGLTEHNINGLHDWLSYTKYVINDMLTIIEEADGKR